MKLQMETSSNSYWYKHDLKRIKDRFSVREIKTSKDIEEWNKEDTSCINSSSISWSWT